MQISKNQSTSIGASPRLWNLYYINTLIVNFIINLASIILINILPLYAMSLGGNNIIAGLLMTLFTLSAFLFRPVFGKMLDTKGRRVVLVLGLCLFAATTILLLLTDSILLLLPLRFVQGIGLSAYSTALATVLSDIVPMDRLSEGVGYFGISSTISMAIAPPLGLYLYSHYSFKLTYVISFLIMISSVIFALLINYERKRTTGEAVKRSYSKTSNYVKKQSFFEKTSIRPCIVMFFTVTANSAVFSFMPIFAKERSIDNIGLFFTVYAVSMIVSRLVTGRIADRYGFYKAYLPSIILTFLLFITLTFAYSLPMVLLAAVFYGVGYGTLQPIMNAIIIKLCPPERRGLANATYYASLDMSFCIGSLVWGTASQLADFTVVFLACAGCVAISLILYYLILHRQIREHEDSLLEDVEI